ncbi:MAG: response regulator [Verrucomicrobiota bacterium]|jgi:DNA-binding response OmpR family regulator
MRVGASISSDFGRNGLSANARRPFAAPLAMHEGKSFRVMTDKARILVVEDEMPLAMMMAFLLARVGCEAKTALNVEKALQLAQAETFDLITIDLEMSGTNGFELFQRLKQIPHLSDTPIVFISARATIENQQYALDELGAADFIEKPFDTQDFVSRIISHVSDNDYSSLVEVISESSMA